MNLIKSKLDIYYKEEAESPPPTQDEKDVLGIYVSKLREVGMITLSESVNLINQIYQLKTRTEVNNIKSKLIFRYGSPNTYPPSQREKDALVTYLETLKDLPISDYCKGNCIIEEIYKCEIRTEYKNILECLFSVCLEKSPDIKGDCCVDDIDKAILEDSYNLCSTDMGYDDRADFTGDCCINQIDLTKMDNLWTCGDGICQSCENDTKCPEDCNNINCGEFVCGDINVDSEINGADTIKLERIVNCLDVPMAGERARSDVNGDGVVSELDIEYLRKYLLATPDFEQLKCPCLSLPDIITETASDIICSSAILKGNLDNLDNTSEKTCLVWFEWGPTPDYGKSTPKREKLSTGQFNANISNLNPGKTYHFRACASNTAGIRYGSDSQFTTPNIDPPTNSDAKNPTSNCIELTWTRGIDSEKTLIVRKEGSCPTSRTDGEQVYFDDGPEINDCGLNNCTKYCYCAWAYNSDCGYSDGSNCDCETTICTPPILSYDPPALNFGTVCKGYTGSKTFKVWNSGIGTLLYKLDESSGWIIDINPSNGTSTGEQDTIIVIVNVDTYSLNIGEYNDNIDITSNDSNGTVEVNINVECLPPLKPTLISPWGELTNPQKIYDTTPQLEWKFNDPDVMNTQFRYQVRVYDVRSGNQKVWDSGEVESFKTYCIIPFEDKLEPSQIYYWKCKTNNGICWSDWSEKAFFIIDPNVNPPVISRLNPEDEAITICIETRKRKIFQVKAKDIDEDLDRVHWYINGAFRGSHQISGYSVLDSWEFTFDSCDTYFVKASVWDEKDNNSYVMWTVYVNCPPDLSFIGNKTGNENELITFKISAIDPDNDILIYSASNLPEGADFNADTKTFTWKPIFFCGEFEKYPPKEYLNIRFEVTDGYCTEYEEITISVNVDNSADPDEDYLPNFKENLAGTDRWCWDSDGDGLSDGDELNGWDISNLEVYDPVKKEFYKISEFTGHASDPNNEWIYGLDKFPEDIDGDGTNDLPPFDSPKKWFNIANSPYLERDVDGNNICNLQDENLITYLTPKKVKTDPLKKDTDGDGIYDNADSFPTESLSKYEICEKGIKNTFIYERKFLGTYYTLKDVIQHWYDRVCGYPVYGWEEIERSSIENIVWFDTDKDHLSIGAEHCFGTVFYIDRCISNRDMDNDGVSDFEEIIVKKTDPMTKDEFSLTKHLAFAQVSFTGKEVIHGGITIYIDLPDIMRETQDGVCDWITIWYQASFALGVSLIPVVDGGVTTLNLGSIEEHTIEEDPPINNGLGLSIQTFFLDINGGIHFNPTLSIGVDYDLIRFDVKRAKLEEAGLASVEKLLPIIAFMRDVKFLESLDEWLKIIIDGRIDEVAYLRDADKSGCNFIEGQDPKPYVVKSDCHPFAEQGILKDSLRVPNDTSVNIKVKGNIDINDESIILTIDGNQVVPILKELNNSKKDYWVIYHPPNNFSFDKIVNVAIDAANIYGDYMETYKYNFKVESQQDHINAQIKSPPSITDKSDPNKHVVIAKEGSCIEGAKIEYNADEIVKPRFGPNDKFPPLEEAISIGRPLVLEPPHVFNNPVAVFIPCPDVDDLSALTIYYFNPAIGWKQASYLNDWMKPNSRQNHIDTFPPTIEIKINHFSAVQAGISEGPKPDLTNKSGGGGCFISSPF